MYTKRLIGDTKNIELRRRMVNVEFTNGTVTFNKEFQFKVDESLETIKKVVQEYLDELNFVPPTITDLEVVEVTPEEPTAAEIARAAYDKERAELAVLMELVRDGVFTGTEPQVVNRQNSVRAAFKAEYLE